MNHHLIKNRTFSKISSTEVSKTVLKIEIIPLICIITTTIFLAQNAYAIKITEIMFNPQGSDTGREWIEITSDPTDGCINTSEYRLYEAGTNHIINTYSKGNTCEYLLICSDVNAFLLDYPYLNDTYFPVYKSTFSLNNDGELLAIKKNGTILYEINYSDILKQITVREGYSLEYVNNTWRESLFMNGDPGNVIADALAEQNYTEETQNITNYTGNYSYENNSNVSEYINQTINYTNTNYSEYTNTSYSYNDTNNLNNTNSNYTDSTNINYNNVTDNNSIYIIENITSVNNTSACNASINILIKNESLIYENKAQIKFYNKIYFNCTSNTNKDCIDINYSIEYWVEDLDGEIYKNKLITNNQNEKSFTPDIKEDDKILVIKNMLKEWNNTECNININRSEKMLIIKNSNYTPSTISCPKCSDTKKATSTCDDAYMPIMPIMDAAFCNSTQKPEIKLVNICIRTENNTANSSIKNNAIPSIDTNLYVHYITNTTNDNYTKNISKLAGMIVYESPNLKNRAYALIGLVLVSLAGIAIIFRKFLFKKNLKITKQ